MRFRALVDYLVGVPEGIWSDDDHFVLSPLQTRLNELEVCPCDARRTLLSVEHYDKSILFCLLSGTKGRIIIHNT